MEDSPCDARLEQLYVLELTIEAHHLHRLQSLSWEITLENRVQQRRAGLTSSGFKTRVPQGPASPAGYEQGVRGGRDAGRSEEHTV